MLLYQFPFVLILLGEWRSAPRSLHVND